MKLRLPLAALPLAAAALLSLAGSLAAQTTARQQMVGQVFKNVQALKEVSVDDFLGTMGIMSASLGFDCSECHNNAGTDKVNWAADDNAKKVIARRMVVMVNKINQENFGGRPNVTCWTCHHGRDRPAQTPTMDFVYGPGPTDPDDVITQAPGQPQATAVIDKFIAAIGGAAKVGAIKSYIATGKSIGFGGFGNVADVTIYAKAPSARTTWIHFKAETERPDAIRVTDGTTGWFKTPLAVITEYQLTGNELNGAKVDALLGFPANIKTSFTNFKVGLAQTIGELEGPSSQTDNVKGVGIGKDRAVTVVQGTGPGGELATMYFDQQTNLLIRVIRYSSTPIGRVPTQTDYSDYRDVNGVKMPFRLTFAWLDGRDAIQLDKIQTNVTIPDAKFTTPENVMKP